MAREEVRLHAARRGGALPCQETGVDRVEHLANQVRIDVVGSADTTGARRLGRLRTNLFTRYFKRCDLRSCSEYYAAVRVVYAPISVTA